MNPFIKSNSIPLAILAMGIILLFAGLGKRESGSSATKSPQDILANIDNIDHVVPADAFDMLQDPEQYVFVDLRNPGAYSTGHLEHALNIPIASLLEETSLTALHQFLADEKTVVLYGQHERDAIGPWILLQQMGFSNTCVLYGGYACFDEPGADCPTGYPQYPFAEVAQQGGFKEVKVIKEKSTPVEPKKKTIPIEKKVKMEAEGGC